MNALRRLLWRLCRPCHRQPKPYQIKVCTEEPEELDPDSIYVVGESGHLWHIVFVCPCGCEQQIFLSLLPNERPRWSFSTTWDDKASLHPSINRVRGCCSHFWIRDGRVQWAGSEASQQH